MEPAGGGFSEDQFREACAELRRPALPGASWELLLEALGISIYGLLDQQTGLYEYKVFGVLDNCLPDVLADVYMDLDYRKQWDQYVKELYEKECNGETVVYWQVKYPFPMSNRDYIYIRQRRDLDLDGRKIHVILAQSTSVPQIAERSGVVRVNQYKQSLAIESDGKKGSKGFYLSNDVWRGQRHFGGRPQITGFKARFCDHELHDFSRLDFVSIRSMVFWTIVCRMYLQMSIWT
uniref:Phosphatidylcholine transfer protein n=1 Tax=Canis lupus familiaris TaxID=9615 RepID=A0A8I3P1T8_CANLF